jgi:4'-phosphopantetheinyl transferase
VWWANLDPGHAEIAGALRELSSDERERANRFVRPIHRNRFVVARAFARRVLAQYLDVSPSAIRFDYGENGKPQLGANPATGKVHFNVAHSGNRAVMAVSQSSEVGIDLEEILPKPNCLQIAGRFFAREEYQALAALDGEDRLRAFYRCWTRKEACLKAIGAGLSIPLDSFAVAIEAEEFPAISHAPVGIANHCSLIDIGPDQNFAAALAILNATESPSRIRHFQFP